MWRRSLAFILWPALVAGLLCSGVSRAQCPYPPGGTDPVRVLAVIEINLVGKDPEVIELTGDAVLERTDPYRWDDLNAFDYEIVDLWPVGSSPSLGWVEMRNLEGEPVAGTLQEWQPDTCFPAESVLFLFLEIEVERGVAGGPQILRAPDMAVAVAEVDGYPFSGVLYEVASVPLPLEDAAFPGAEMGRITGLSLSMGEAVHVCDFPAGEELLDVQADATLEWIGEETESVVLTGLTKIVRSEGYPEGGRWASDLEFPELGLTGMSIHEGGEIDLVLREAPTSTGWLREEQPGTCLPVEATVDLFPEVHLADGRRLVSREPVTVSGTLDDSLSLLGQGLVSSSPPADLFIADGPDVSVARLRRMEFHFGSPGPPCGEYPGGGTELFEASAEVTLRIGGLPEAVAVPLLGQVRIRRSDPYRDGIYTVVEPELVGLDLSGWSGNLGGEIVIHTSGSGDSHGRLSERRPDGCFPADVGLRFPLEVTIPGPQALVTNGAISVSGSVQGLPLLETEYHPDASSYSLFRPEDLQNSAGTLEITYVSLHDAVPEFVRGDANANGRLSLGDVLAILSQIFRQKTMPCPDAADADDSGKVELADAVWLLKILFTRTVAPKPPFPSCGVDTTTDKIGCESYTGCG